MAGTGIDISGLLLVHLLRVAKQRFLIRVRSNRIQKLYHRLDGQAPNGN